MNPNKILKLGLMYSKKDLSELLELNLNHKY
jgi:hypothetical protein